jgi:hypothetical protein
MNAELESAPSRKSWVLNHPFLVTGIILTACLGPFINKAVHMDDPLFIWTGKWIQTHPADFFGFNVNWWGTLTPMSVANCNPPLMSYFLAGVGSVFGWSETMLHLACLAVAFLAAAGIYSLARMWCAYPLLATVIAILTPVFMVSGSTLMCDVLMLTFWVWALVLWERAVLTGKGGWQFIVAGLLAGLAVLTKYSVVTLLPLLPLLSLLRKSKPGWWLAGAAMPLIMVLGYEWLTAQMYGKGLLSAAADYAQAHRTQLAGGWLAREIIALAFAGGSLLPLLFFSPRAWPRRIWLRGSLVLFGILWLLFWLGGDPGIFHPSINPQSFYHWGFRLQLILLTAGGLHLLALTGAETWQRRDSVTFLLACWIAIGLLFAAVLNWTVSARSFLPIAPAAAILLVRRLESMRGSGLGVSGILWPLAPTAAITFSLVLADYQLANTARTAAKQIADRYPSSIRKVWFEQHMGFQYYMEQLGARPIDCEQSVLQPDDIVVVPRINYGFIPFPLGSVGWMDPLIYRPVSWMNLSRDTQSGAAGFYSVSWGPVPFVIGKLPPQEFFLLKVFSNLQFNTQPLNPNEVLSGGTPVFGEFSAACVDLPLMTVSPEAGKQSLLAGQLEAEGRFAEAIQLYRDALATDPDNPILLNNLAWILATAGNFAAGEGNEAVQLALRAVTLTDRRQPLFMGTLGAAYAAAGQFEKATRTAEAAETLALLTNQRELAYKNHELMAQFAAGKTANSTAGSP